MAPSLLPLTATPLEVFFIPWYATSHITPIIDTARLFAARGVSSTVLTTPANASILHPSPSLPLHTLLYPFPSAETGIPPGAENVTTIPPAHRHKIFTASAHARPSIQRLLRLHRPHAIIADSIFTWMVDLGRELGVPVVFYHTTGLFPVAVMRVVSEQKPHDSVSSDSEPFLVPGLPHDVHMVRSELPLFLLMLPRSIEPYIEAEAKCFGFIANSFDAIESDYADFFLNSRGIRTWLVGPVAAVGDSENGSNEGYCLGWLDSQLAKSVVYVCFGSWWHFSGDQMRELAVGLERCGHPFVWVVREDDGAAESLPPGFEERVGGRGLVVRGWAPQTAVLGHESVGGFVTHCGWNSVLEGLAAGMPMVTWPLVVEQFINERLVTEVLRVGVKCRRGAGSTAEEGKEVVGGEEVAAAVGRIMDDGEEEEAAAMRRRAEEYAVRAKEAVEEGGSSYNALTDLIEEFKVWPKKEQREEETYEVV